MELLQHNRDAYDKVMAHLETNKSAAIVHCTGSGKTYAAAAVAARFKKVLFVAPVVFILNEHRKLNGNATYATYAKILFNYEDVGSGFDLIVLDEFHRCGAENWGAAVDRLLGDNPQAKVLGLTATNVRYLEGRDMASEMFENSVVSTLSMKDAILQGIMIPPKYVVGYYTFDVTYDKYQSKIDESTASVDVKGKAKERLDEIRVMWSKAMNVDKLLIKHMPKQCRRVLVFTQNIHMLQECKQVVPEWLRSAGVDVFKTYDVNCDNDSSVSEMNEFQRDDYEGAKVMFSVNMLNEGVHVPNVDVVIMLRRTISKNIYLQQIGRCMSTDRSRQPVILDLVANATRTDDLAEWIEIKRAYDCRRLTNEGRRNGLEFDFSIEDYTMDIQEFLQSVDQMLPHPFDMWEERKPLIDAHYEKYGHLPTMSEDKVLHIYVRSFARKDDRVSCKANARFESIVKYLMTMGFDPNTYARSAFDTLENVKIATEERGFYTPYEFQLIRSNLKKNSDNGYKEIFDEFVDTHMSKLMYEHKKLLTDILPTIDWCDEIKSMTPEQQKCAALAKKICIGKRFAWHSDKYMDDLRVLCMANPYIPQADRGKEKLRRFIVENNRLPNAQQKKGTVRYCDLTEEQRNEDNLYRKMCSLLRDNDQDAIRWKEEYGEEVQDPRDVMLDRLEEFVSRTGRYPNSKGQCGNDELALLRYTGIYRKTLNDEQRSRYDAICGELSPEYAEKVKAEWYDSCLEQLKVFVAKNGYVPLVKDGELGNFVKLYRKDDAVQEVINGVPNIKEYRLLHPEMRAYENIKTFIDEYGRLPIPNITAETYTARCIRKCWYYEPIRDLVLPLKDTAEQWLKTFIENQNQD